VTITAACPPGVTAESATSNVDFSIVAAAQTQSVSTNAGTATEDVKVTLCHRTHAENNPYVRITVSVNAVNRPSGHQGHDEIFGDAHVYTAGIYKRAKDKKWGDIIPPDPTGQNRWRALNWTTLGQEIFNGTVAGCKLQSPQEYYNALRESGVPEKDIKRELAQLEEDQEKTEKTNLKDLGYTGKNALVLEQEKDKVTICHRTAAVTNPYRKITVAASSIYKRAGHLDHNESYNGNTVFNPSITYPANQKRWGDIIPPDPTGQNRWRALNWNAAGQAMYNGSVAGCSEQTYQEYYNALREDGIPKKDVFRDIERQGNIDDDPVDTDGVQYTGDDPEVEKTEPREPTPPDNKPVIDQSLSGIVWLDRNRDGLKDADEPLMPNIVLTVVQVSATASASTKSIGMSSVSAASTLQPAATTTVLTDKDGFYVFPSLGAGDWRVVAGVPDQLNVTYDSQGSPDGSVQTTVPPGSSAFTWVGLVGANGTTNQELVRLIESGKFTPEMLITAGLAKPGALAPGSSSSSELAATGSNELWWLAVGLAMIAIGALSLRRSRRLEN
jgi:LPXTG-motif cell wall-anchored protein